LCLLHAPDLHHYRSTTMPDFIDKLRLKEQADEDQYFARRDRELIDALHARRGQRVARYEGGCIHGARLPRLRHRRVSTHRRASKRRLRARSAWTSSPLPKSVSI